MRQPPSSPTPIPKAFLLLMEEIRLTTWDVWNPVNNGINYQPQLVRRISEPSTAVCPGHSAPAPGFDVATSPSPIEARPRAASERVSRWRLLAVMVLQLGTWCVFFWLWGGEATLLNRFVKYSIFIFFLGGGRGKCRSFFWKHLFLFCWFGNGDD